MAGTYDDILAGGTYAEILAAPQPQQQPQPAPRKTARSDIEKRLMQEAMAKRSGMQNFLAGAGKAAVDTGFGLKQLGAMAGNAVGLVDDATMQGLYQEAAQRRERDADLMDTGAGLVGNIAGNVGMVVGGGLGLRAAGAGAAKVGATRAASALGTAGGGVINPQSVKAAAAVGAALGAMQPGTSAGDKAKQAVIGGVAGAAGQKVGEGIGRLAKGASDTIRPETRALAERAKQLGINLRADQITRSRPAGVLAETLKEVPFSGAQAAESAQQKQFNTAISRTVGENIDNPAEALARASVRLSREFDDTLRNNAVQFDNQLQADLSAIVAEASDVMSDQHFGVISKQVDTLLNKAAAGNGSIEGQAAYALKKRLDLLGKSSDTTTAHYAREMKWTLMDALNRSLGPEKAQAFANTRRQYANMLELEKIVPRGAEADISAARLANAKGIRTQDLGELADIAATFMRKPVGDSGTTPRWLSALGGGGLAAGAVTTPVVTGATAVGGAIAGRGSVAALNSAFLREYAMNGMSPAARSLLAKARAAAGVLPASAALPLSQGQ